MPSLEDKGAKAIVALSGPLGSKFGRMVSAHAKLLKGLPSIALQQPYPLTHRLWGHPEFPDFSLATSQGPRVLPCCSRTVSSISEQAHLLFQGKQSLLGTAFPMADQCFQAIQFPG